MIEIRGDTEAFRHCWPAWTMSFALSADRCPLNYKRSGFLAMRTSGSPPKSVLFRSFQVASSPEPVVFRKTLLGEHPRSFLEWSGRQPWLAKGDL